MLIEGLKLGLEERVISVVGGGGKTSLILCLAEELSENKRVIITTTTRMELICPKRIDKYIISSDITTVKKELNNLTSGEKCIFLALEKVSPDKVKGIWPLWIEELKELSGIEKILVEADGSQGKPLKGGYLEYEPVIPFCSDVLIYMTGIDVLGKKLTEEHVHRAELAAKISGLSLEKPLKENNYRKIIELTSRRATNMAKGARNILFFNKVDTEKDLHRITPIAKKLSKSNKVKFDRVVLASLKSKHPLQKVLS